jgi:hypothetical protein
MVERSSEVVRGWIKGNGWAYRLLLGFLALASVVTTSGHPVGAATILDFEDFPLAPQSNLAANSPNPAPLVAEGVEFNRSWSTEFACCPGGWAVSNQTDQSTAGPASAYAAYVSSTQGGGFRSSQFAVGTSFSRGEAAVRFPEAVTVTGMYVTNVTYAYLAVGQGNDGAGFVKGPFGPGDWFRLDVIGVDGEGHETGRVPVYLADFRDASAFVIDEWTWLDLSPLGRSVHGLEFEMSSTDSGGFGMNTPAFFAIDDLTYQVVPEPSAALLAFLGVLMLWQNRRRVRPHSA